MSITLDSTTLVRQELTEARAVLDRFLNNDQHLEAIIRAAQMIANAFHTGGKVLACGNGGSHCDAMHFAEELTGRYRKHRPAYPAIAISDPGYLSCVANDYGYEQVFSRYIEALGQPDDILLAISTSGSSPNVIKAVNTAKDKGMQIVVLSGNDGGQLAGHADVEIRVPHLGYADRIQEVHIKVIHIMIHLIEQQMTIHDG